MEDNTRVKSISSATIHAPIEDVKVDHENGSHQPGFETISAQKTSDHSIKRTYFPGIIDILEVTDPAEIRTISTIQGSIGTSQDMVLFATCCASGKCSAFSR